MFAISNSCKNCGIEINKRSTFCSNKCQSEFQYKEYISRWKKGEENGLKGSYQISNHLKRYVMEKFNYACCECGWSKENPYTKNIPLEVEHIDGDYQNNNEDNLKLLCPNCHSLTATYKGANRGNGRKERSKYNLKSA